MRRYICKLIKPKYGPRKVYIADFAGSTRASVVTELMIVGKCRSNCHSVLKIRKGAAENTVKLCVIFTLLQASEELTDISLKLLYVLW